jgi:hypothetical protein
MHNYKEIKVWQKSRTVVKSVYQKNEGIGILENTTEILRILNGFQNSLQ